MTNTSDIKAAGTGLAGGAIASALLDILIEKNVITLAMPEPSLTELLRPFPPMSELLQGRKHSKPLQS